MSKKKSVILSDLLKEIVELIAILIVIQVFFSCCRVSVEKNAFSLTPITVSYFFSKNNKNKIRLSLSKMKIKWWEWEK